MDIDTKDSIDTLTLNAELILQDSNRKVAIEIYDDGHDLVLFATGDDQEDIQIALELFSSKEPITPHINTGGTVEDIGTQIFYFSQNPTRKAMRLAANFTKIELEKHGFSTKINDQWD